MGILNKEAQRCEMREMHRRPVLVFVAQPNARSCVSQEVMMLGFQEVIWIGQAEQSY